MSVRSQSLVKVTVALAAAFMMLVGAFATPAAAHHKNRGGNVADAFLAVSTNADRSDAVALDGAVVSTEDDVAIFVAPVNTRVRAAIFYVNDRPVKLESYTPYDLAGTRYDGTAALIPADYFAPGENTVSVELITGWGWWWFRSSTTLTSTFTVAEPAAGSTIGEIAVATDELSTLVTALSVASESGPIDFLQAVNDPNGDFTVFAPTNAAFDALGDTLGAALADPSGLLTNVLLEHIVNQSLDAGELLGAQTVINVGGNPLTIEAIGDGVFVNGAQVVIANIQASNGIVHVIDAVILPPAPEPPALSTIAEIALGSDDLTTLVTALSVATESGPIDFLGVVNDPDADLTVFAPTNAAFDALGDTLGAALADPSGLLTAVLSQHVLGESLDAGELLAAGSVVNIGNGVLNIEQVGDAVFINGAQVVIANIEASNGIVHVIDAVILPAPAVRPVPVPQ